MLRITLLCLGFLAFLVSADPVKIPLYRRSESGLAVAAGKQLDHGILAGKVQIGEPPEEFTLAFDTTTGFSWVRGSRCKSENCLDRCTYYARHSSTVKSTKHKFSVEYGDACVDTRVYLDTFRFANITVHDMPFGGAYRMSGFGHGFDGYLGLGRSVNFNSTKIHSSSSGGLAKRAIALPDSAFVPNAYQQATGLDSAQFGMYTTTTSNDGFSQTGASQQQQQQQTTTTSGGLGFAKRSTNAQPDEPVGGYLVMGGVDKTAIQGDVQYIDLARTDEAQNWDVCIRDANFDGELNLKQKKNALASISSSSSQIVMPRDQADQFHDVFGGRFNHTSRAYQFVCCEAEKLPSLKLTLEDTIVELPSKYWVEKTAEGDEGCCATCATRISRGNTNRDWVLGTAFTNAFYTTFDPEGERIGLALKKDNNDEGLRIYKKTPHH
ncbi:1,3-beta-glucanosyltransferase [Apophysomyces sp. BC1034]|nr:1,3-beta-glucanosyltransferase [Apophysomyces sp. BC1015]KAG0176846.1 1,3-beta-glucanosyltransferase [Apophysomyces sp. BC1021]KAG0187183.1 1,3-beta-glucanosyltransferase [Apophysomyces sp. BC1034]